MIENWIIPCNVKFFNLIDHFKKEKTVVWKNAFTIKKGDTVYIYVGKPFAEIMYKCSVVNDCVDDDLLKDNQYAIPKKKSKNYYSKKEKYIQLKLIKCFEQGTFPLNNLREHGLGQVQIQARTNRKLQNYLDEVEKELVSG